MLWSTVQLNKAFGWRGGVHIQLAGMDQRVLGGLRTRERAALGRRGRAGRGGRLRGPFETRRRTVVADVSWLWWQSRVLILTCTKFYILISSERNPSNQP